METETYIWVFFGVVALLALGYFLWTGSGSDVGPDEQDGPQELNSMDPVLYNPEAGQFWSDDFVDDSSNVCGGQTE
jgi:hypothetical protein